MVKEKTIKERYIVNICSERSEDFKQWVPKSIITRKIGEEYQDFPLTFSINTKFDTKSKADKYSLNEAKIWISKYTGVKNVTTRGEWIEDKVVLVIVTLFFLLSIGLLANMIISDL